MIKINIDPESFYINKSENLIGIIYFEIDDFIFVSDDWYDFVNALLAWLGKVVLHLAKNEAKKVEMSFMEGPYKIALTLKEDFNCTIDCIEGEELSGSEEVTHKTSIVPLDQIVDAILNACEIVIQKKESGAIGFDRSYDNLRETYQSLQSYKNINHK